MNQKANKEKHQNIPTFIITKPTKYNTVTLPPKVTYSDPSLLYENNNNYKVNIIYETSTTKTKTITITNNIYPYSIYNSNNQYWQSTNDNNIRYNINTYNQNEINQYNIERKTFPFKGIKNNKTQIKNTFLD